MKSSSGLENLLLLNLLAKLDKPLTLYIIKSHAIFYNTIQDLGSIIIVGR